MSEAPKKPSEMDENTWKNFKFAEHQLGVVDTKANNVLMVDSVLIVISTLSVFFESTVEIDTLVKSLSIMGTIFVLVSVFLCLRTIWVKWADEHLTVENVKKTRDLKTKFLHSSIIMLFIALSFYVAMFVVDFPIKS